MRYHMVCDILAWVARSTRSRSLIAIGALAVVMSGCSLHFDVDSVELQSDAGASPTDTDADAGGDSSDAVLTCPGSPGSVRGECAEPGSSAGCPTSETCSLGFTGDHLESYCYDNASFGDGARGDACTNSDDCGSELYCVSWVDRGPICSKLCNLATGRGCTGGEVCTNPMADLLDGVGFCTESCDPYSLDACSSSQSCTPDPNFPEGACEPTFRCISNNGSQANAPGDPCDRADPAKNCARGLVCAPLEGGQICVEPCSSATNCPDTSACVELQAPWDLTYCELS